MRLILLGIVLGLTFCIPAAAGAAADESGQTLGLETLDLSHMRQGYGTPQINRSVREKPLTIAGRTSYVPFTDERWFNDGRVAAAREA